jgi:hypothetical protein
MNDPASHYQVHAVMTSGDFNEEERQRLVDNLQGKFLLSTVICSCDLY